MSYAKFQTPKDISRYGAYRENSNAKSSVLVSFKSCVAKGLRGAANIVVILDEVAHFTDEGQSSADAVYEAIVPSTATFSPKDAIDSRKPVGPVEAKVISISSPLGRQGLFYKLFSDGFRGGSLTVERLCIQAPTWEVNPTIPGGFFEGEYLKDSRSFFTEYGAEFSDRTRGWLEKREDLLACVRPELRPRTRAAPRLPHFAGIDVGLVNDGTVIAVGHVEDNTVVLDNIEQIKAGEGDYAHQERLEFADVAEWIHDYSRRFYITQGIFDQWAGIPLEQALSAKGLSQFEALHHTQTITSQMYQNFKDMMFDKRLALYNWPLTTIDGVQQNCEYIAQLLELQAEYKSKYVTIVAAPKVAGKHDDYADALVRMVWAASQGMSKQNTFGGTNKRPILHGAGRAPTSRDLMFARKKAMQTGSHPDRQVPKFGRDEVGFGTGGFGKGGFGRGGFGRGGGGWGGFGRGR
jgi:hypothetical protein